MHAHRYQSDDTVHGRGDQSLREEQDICFSREEHRSSIVQASLVLVPSKRWRTLVPSLDCSHFLELISCKMHSPIRLALIAGLLSTTVKAHMEMSSPAPFRSKYLGISANTDYSMTSPLEPSANGVDSLCKGFLSDLDSSSPTGKLVAGSTVSTRKLTCLHPCLTFLCFQMNVEIAGTASHLGGSCEFSVSYDSENFVVIHRIVGGCPLKSSYSFKVPEDLPGASKAVFSWSWISESP